ncbi:MAG: hypothetical protein K8T25_18090 [Planctomycetia bacterium]|nr:hypothetical protein [Planctomycetia bacterium]
MKSPEIFAAAVDGWRSEMKKDCDIIRGGCGAETELEDHQELYAALVEEIAADDGAETFTNENMTEILASVERDEEDLTEDVLRIHRAAAMAESRAMFAQLKEERESYGSED